MMLPATTASPPNFLMPRRRPAVSRPLREEPPAFLCAIALLLLRLGIGRGQVLGRVTFDDALTFGCLKGRRIVGLGDMHRRVMRVVLDLLWRGSGWRRAMMLREDRGRLAVHDAFAFRRFERRSRRFG